MLPSFIRHRDRLRHARFAWALAWLAVLLNLAAPVIAYGAFATSRLQHGLAHAQHEAPVPHTDPHAGHHGYEHASHNAHEHPPGDDSADSPVTPHCNYCLDFAAGALLTPVVDAGVKAVRIASAMPAAREASARPKPDLRLAYPRGPPPTA